MDKGGLRVEMTALFPTRRLFLSANRQASSVQAWVFGLGACRLALWHRGCNFSPHEEYGRLVRRN